MIRKLKLREINIQVTSLLGDSVFFHISVNKMLYYYTGFIHLHLRDITLLKNVHIVKIMVFPVVMYGCESWILQKAEHWRTDAIELWCWRRLLSPLDSKKFKPVNIKGSKPWIFIGRTNAEVEAPVLWAPDTKSWLIGKDVDGNDWRRRGYRNGWMASSIQWTWVWTNSRR